MMNITRRLRELGKEKDGAAAIEFAMLILPFSLTLLVIFEIALMFFVDSALDAAVQKASRAVRVGVAQSSGWDLAKFKEQVCGNMAYYFKCTERLMVTSTPVVDVSSVTYLNPVVDGALNVTENFDPGEAEDFVLIQAFLPWDPILPFYNFSYAQLTDGTYILGTANLFKNEPF